MANTLSVWDPLFYAQEALIQLEKALGLAGRIHRGYDASPQQKGSVIQIKKPATFTAQDAPSSAQDIEAGSTSITLDQWREVKFGLMDKELSHTKEDIINDHIRPAAYALADDVDQKLAALYADVPWFFDVAAGPGSGIVLSDIAQTRKVLFDNAAPMDDGNMHLMVGGAEEAALLPLLSPQNLNTGGAETLARAAIGSVFGSEVFANQNTPSHTPGVSADADGALVGAHAKGATTVNFDGTTASGTFKKGDSFVIAGNTQRYAITADVTESTGVTASIFPALVQAHADNDVINVRLDTHVSNLMFHRNAFALATAPLSELGGQLGARIATISDPITNLSLRSRMYYDGDNSKVLVALDMLYGFKTLDPNLATRLCG